MEATVFTIQVFDADKEFLFTIPMPHLLSRYEQGFIIDLPKWVAADRAEHGADDPTDVHHEHVVGNASLLGSIARWQRNETMTGDLVEEITRHIMSATFADPKIRRDFRLTAVGSHIQFALPRDPHSEPEIQWTENTDEYLKDMSETLLNDEEIARQYLAQAEENNRWLKELVNRFQH
jgi:hypothetical protein